MFIVNTILSIQNVHIIGGTPFQYNCAKKTTPRKIPSVVFLRLPHYADVVYILAFIFFSRIPA